jgi:L-2-hydroxyglutarate oxidase LhgO
VILERNDTFGSETSARNSEVIHAGLYYPTARSRQRCALLAAGNSTDFCATHGISHRRCGKLIVATPAAPRNDTAARAAAQGEANGVDDLRWLSAAEARALEPELACTAALLSPSTGIIDSHGLMLALLGDAERAGAVLALQQPAAAAARIEPTASSSKCGGSDSLRLQLHQW